MYLSGQQLCLCCMGTSTITHLNAIDHVTILVGDKAVQNLGARTEERFGILNLGTKVC